MRRIKVSLPSLLLFSPSLYTTAIIAEAVSLLFLDTHRIEQQE